MAKLFIGYVSRCYACSEITGILTRHCSGLAWHTDDETLREGFAPFGTILEAVGYSLCSQLDQQS